MWQRDWRSTFWSQIDRPWDLIIVGGGVTGAGILREAARLGVRALLVEQRDFAWGTSSRSSKLVHGGLRYLKEGKLRLTRNAVRERERLLDEAPGLIDPLGFLLATYKGDKPGRWTYKVGLSIYDLLALRWTHRYYSAADFEMLAPRLAPEGLRGGFRYGDAQTDDARLVLRLIQEAVEDGGVAINYVGVCGLVEEAGRVVGVRLREEGSGREAEVRARVVINATGAWADRLRTEVGAPPRMRPLRGSHLIFPAWRLPVAQAVGFLHPADRRPVFVFPWEGITLVGTTDLDHDRPLDEEPAISPEEVDYLLEAVRSEFPGLGLEARDVIATFAGVRPVVGSERVDPSKESRDHVIWQEGGLLTVTGGKLTTFRLIALDALHAVRQHLPGLKAPGRRTPVLNPVDLPLPEGVRLEEALWRRLLGRYGSEAPAVVAAARPDELAPIPGLQTLWAELRWAARVEAVEHLDDLLLRRVRLGLLLPEGGRQLLPAIRDIVLPELGWDEARWEAEVSAYLSLWRRAYYLPERLVQPGTVAS